MANAQASFFLKSNGETLGTVTLEREDWPWIHGKFTPSEGFANYSPLFEAAITEYKDNKDGGKLEALHKTIRLNLQLIRCDTGILAGEPDLLWIKGERIWWRGHSGALRELANND